MADFLDAPKVSAAFIEIIKSAEEQIFIVSPYISLTPHNKKYLQSIDDKKVPIDIVYRSDTNPKPEDLTFFKQLQSAQLYKCNDLHAKCYINELFGIITSMNLYEHSQSNNWEMGVRFSRETDPDLYTQTLEEVERILQASSPENSDRTATASQRAYEPRKPTRTISPKLKAPPKKGFLEKALDSVLGEEAHCIRCGEMIDYNPEKPYCPKCFASWARFNNPDYKEKVCHKCGTKHTTTKTRPVCNDCYKTYYR
ncbi:phospholipase D family protein [Methanoculleus sp.]|uniref:phospholipase D family protein n=1 Tax=Methanoculleus sp. TaxID=90427 RepID=UPI002C8137F2|nr:phospholipase D family protein [Methanoculleus sp.]HNT09087.1 phospholipase D family protein [Methanoculleus sp.]